MYKNDQNFNKHWKNFSYTGSAHALKRELVIYSPSKPGTGMVILAVPRPCNYNTLRVIIIVLYNYCTKTNICLIPKMYVQKKHTIMSYIHIIHQLLHELTASAFKNAFCHATLMGNIIVSVVYAILNQYSTPQGEKLLFMITASDKLVPCILLCTLDSPTTLENVTKSITGRYPSL